MRFWQRQGDEPWTSVVARIYILTGFILQVALFGALLGYSSTYLWIRVSNPIYLAQSYVFDVQTVALVVVDVGIGLFFAALWFLNSPQPIENSLRLLGSTLIYMLVFVFFISTSICRFFLLVFDPSYFVSFWPAYPRLWQNILTSFCLNVSVVFSLPLLIVLIAAGGAQFFKYRFTPGTIQHPISQSSRSLNNPLFRGRAGVIVERDRDRVGAYRQTA